MPAPAKSTPDVQRTVLPNGIRVVTEAMPHVRSVAVGVWIGTGSRSEPANESGICHFVEHMLFKGTTRRSAQAIARDVDAIGGNLDAFTAKELVSFDIKVLDEHLAQGFDVLSDLILDPLFPAHEFDREKKVIIEELKMEADNPEYVVHEMFASNFWKGHGLGRPILGTRETVRRFSRDAVVEHYNRTYTGANTIITAAGNIAHERIVALAADGFGRMPAGAPAEHGPRPGTHAHICLKDKKALEQAHVCLGVPSYPLPHSDRFACYVLNTILGGGMSSRLFQEIRERQGLAYSVFSDLNPYRDTGCLLVYAGASIEQAGRLIRSICDEFSRLKEEYVTEDELRRAINYLKGSLALSLESSSSRMSNLARQEMYFGRFFTIEELEESVERVTREDVQRVAQSFFDTRQIAVTVLGSLNGFRLSREDLAC
ncbi:MAG: M16 family metallopeptidase [bacterium]|jgi:predicted Zn-dependent peptidase